MSKGVNENISKPPTLFLKRAIPLSKLRNAERCRRQINETVWRLQNYPDEGWCWPFLVPFSLPSVLPCLAPDSGYRGVGWISALPVLGLLLVKRCKGTGTRVVLIGLGRGMSCFGGKRHGRWPKRGCVGESEGMGWDGMIGHRCGSPRECFCFCVFVGLFVGGAVLRL
ncbi:hypothetical protein HOY80DRAFT_966719 [Tuber brumale]|nr:hypothetical protein HOY80DRAFT_966719 [Tuber brumale]